MRGALLVVSALALGLPAQEPAPSAPPVDFNQMDRRLVREPAYLAPPLYALFLMDPAGKVRMWAVLDKSTHDMQYYDVLWLDRDADGELGEEGERFQGRVKAEAANAGLLVEIQVADLPVPGTSLRHRKLRLATAPKTGRKGVWFQMLWDGETEVSGGYGKVGLDTTLWGPDPARAPILHPLPQGPFTFGIWGREKELVLPLGGESHLNFILGRAGFGAATLSVVDEDFLVPGQDRIFVTVLGRDAAGQAVSLETEITGHC